MPSSCTVYWQPGCSSCLRTKEFLTEHGIAFESVNVLEVKGAMELLAARGARSVPVVTRGDEFVYAQDLEVLAAFVGIDLNREILSPETLIQRLELVLAAAQRYLQQLPADALEYRLPGRDRTYRDLGYHIFMIPEAFLDAVQGGELGYEYFERTAPDDITGTDKLVDTGDTVREKIRNWWRRASREGYPDVVSTYYGQHSTHSVLERTTWHTAQHTRQLMTVIRNLGLAPDGPLGEDELHGLPLPEEVYDDEVGPGAGVKNRGG